MITNETISKTISYPDYISLIKKFIPEGKTTGLNQTEEYIGYTKINLQRMLRLNKTTVLNPELANLLQKIKREFIWLVITEAWCGDASQNIPVLYQIAEACKNIELKLLLRDENPEVMNHYLTNGTKSIPKLICVEKSSLKEIFVWGPRPKELQVIVQDLKKQQVSKEEKGIITQKWYNENKTQSLQNELLFYIKEFLCF